MLDNAQIVCDIVRLPGEYTTKKPENAGCRVVGL